MVQCDITVNIAMAMPKSTSNADVFFKALEGASAFSISTCNLIKNLRKIKQFFSVVMMDALSPTVSCVRGNKDNY
jgi:hypothetical protein